MSSPPDLEESAHLKGTVDEALHGDPDAWEKLYARLRPRLYGLCLQRLSNNHDAEDAVAETMLRAVDAASSFRWRGGGFDAWVFRICTNVISDMARTRTRRATVLPSGSEIDPGEVEDKTVLDEEHAAVRKAFERLDPEERELLELRLIAQLSSDEAAHVLGRRPGAVRTAQSRALARLRVLLEEESR
jgi:RNA polymerase sigma-70 factor (ECF subfamily)